MITGYTRPLYLLPFDHRASCLSGLFGWKEPLDVEQMATVATSKHIIYAGFQQAIADQVPKDHAGILVDEEFGSALLRDAASKGSITAAPVEKSGQEEFEFAYGEDFAQHIQAVDPTFAKVLVRYNPEEDAALNQRQAGRLKRLSDSLHRTQRLFLFELLVPATPLQLEQVEGDKSAYDLQLRPALMPQAIQALQDAGVEPDVWKVEGLDCREDAVKVVEVARCGGRDTVGLIVLGRGAERERVVCWLKTAARVPGFIGFAVGRTSFWQPLLDVEAPNAFPKRRPPHTLHAILQHGSASLRKPAAHKRLHLKRHTGKECVQKEKTGCPTSLLRCNLSWSGFVLNLVAQAVKLFAELCLANSTPNRGSRGAAGYHDSSNTHLHH